MFSFSPPNNSEVSIGTIHLRAVNGQCGRGYRVLQETLQGNKAGRSLVFRCENCEGSQIRHEIIDATFHDGPQILDCGTAGMTGSLKPELDGSLMDADQLHLAVDFAQAPF